MSRFSPHAPRVGVLATTEAYDAWAKRLMCRWVDEDVWFGRVKEHASPRYPHPELLLLVGNDAEEWEAAAQVVESARKKGTLVVGLVAGPIQVEGAPGFWGNAPHGVIEVDAPESLEAALNSLLRLVLMLGVIRLETEDLEELFRENSCARLTLGWGQGEARIEHAMQAAMQGSHAAILAAPKGHWLVGVIADASLGSTEFNTAGEWLQSRVASAHEITVMASCDETQNDICEVVVMASG